MDIEGARLPKNIAHAKSIQEAQDRAVEPGQQRRCMRGLLQGEETRIHRRSGGEALRVENADRAFQPKDLLKALPLLSKPVIEVRATDDGAMRQAAMPFVPGFRVLPAPSVWLGVGKEVCTIFQQRRLVVPGQQDRGPAPQVLMPSPSAPLPIA